MGLDIIASGSQKGYMIPPGLSFIAMSQKAWEAAEKSNLPKFYLNLKSYRKSLLNNSNPYTPAVNLVFALDEALKMMREEGLDNIFLRHNKHKLAMSNAVKALNLKLFADEKYLSPTKCFMNSLIWGWWFLKWFCFFINFIRILQNF